MSSSCTSVQFRFAFNHKYFLNPTQLSASVQCPVPSCFLAQVLFKPSAALLTTILLMVPSYHVWSTECVQSMLMERCTENQLSILHPSQLTASELLFQTYQQVSSLHSLEKDVGYWLSRFCPLGHVKIVTERCKYKGVSPGCVEFFKFVEHLDVRDEPEAKLRCLSKCYAVHLGVSDTCPEQYGIKAFHRYFAVMFSWSALDKIGFWPHSFDISVPGHRE
ncbi:hypothetical protein F4703DRAFT_1933636 [Phycomyces blakesleeanus]